MDERMAYVVSGETGEYSDHCAWMVRVFYDRAEADQFCAELNEWLKTRGFEYDGEHRHDYEAREAAGHPPGDPQLRIDYTGASYSVCEVPVGCIRTPQGGA